MGVKSRSSKVSEKSVKSTRSHLSKKTGRTSEASVKSMRSVQNGKVTLGGLAERSFADSRFAGSPVALLWAACNPCSNQPMPLARPASGRLQEPVESGSFATLGPPTVDLSTATPLVPATALAKTDRDGQTPLALATQFQHTDLVPLLLNLKAPPDSVDAQGNTPLMLAARTGNRDAVSHLLSARASTEIQNVCGKCPMDLAKGAHLRAMLQSVADRRAVERRVASSKSSATLQSQAPVPNLSKSCSLPSLVMKPATSRWRLRLDGLPTRRPPEELEEFICDTLDDYDLSRPACVEIISDPISMRCQHVFIDFPTARKAIIAEAALRQERLKVSREDPSNCVWVA